MSLEGEKATLRLRIVGPLDGDTELPMGATAWITPADEERIVVTLSTGYNQAPAMVEVPPGRVIIVLRVPAGRRGQYTIFLNPGELKEIEFGTPINTNTNTTSPFGPSPFDSLKLPSDDKKPRRTPVDPNVIEQVRPPLRNGDPWSDIDTGGGGWGGGSSQEGGWGTGTMPSFGSPGKPGPREIPANSWMSQINAVQIVMEEQFGARRLVRHRLTRKKVPSEVEPVESSPQLLQFSAANCLAIILQPAAPFHEKVLLHRSPATADMVTFKIKLREDNSHIPFDTDVVIPDDCITPLLAFLANGDLTSAAAQAKRFAATAQNYIGQKYSNHHLAAVGAYAMYLLRKTSVNETWLYNLYHDFGDLSDGAIIWALQAMRSRPGAIAEWYDEARQALIAAASRPLPILTIGVRMLVEGLERLTSSRRADGDAELSRALARAHWIQARARYDETFTALWLDDKELQEALLPLNWDSIIAK